MANVKKIAIRAKREIAMADLSVSELLLLSTGPCRGFGDTITNMAVAREVYEVFGDELVASYVKRNPGCRPWCAWTFGLLPADPRRRVDPDDSLPANSAEAPTGIWPWSSSGGYESSYRYLSRRNLLGVTELAAIRAKHDGQRILDCHRIELSRIADKYRPNAEMPGYELADLLSLFPEIELTADELRRAEPFIFATT